MEDDLHKKTHAATLEYLTKPSYQSSIFATQHKTTNAAMSVSKEDKRFYKKRILSATKEMFYKTSYPKTLQIIHEEYLANIIEYLKVCDMEDIIQREYDDFELTSSINKFDINNNIQITHNFADQAVLALLTGSEENAQEAIKQTLGFASVISVAIYKDDGEQLISSNAQLTSQIKVPTQIILKQNELLEENGLKIYIDDGYMAMVKVPGLYI